MDRRAAKREAWWRLAQLARSCLEGGYELGRHYPAADVHKIEEAMTEVLAEMERKGHS